MRAGCVLAIRAAAAVGAIHLYWFYYFNELTRKMLWSVEEAQIADAIEMRKDAIKMRKAAWPTKL